MKKSTSVFAAIFVCLMSQAGQAQATSNINGTNPRPQTATAQINGTNPRPAINGTNPRPQTTTSAPATSALPGWVQTVLTVLNLM